MKKEYKIKTLADIRNAVNEKNFQEFILDFTRWLAIGLLIKNTEGVEEKDPDTFHWIDDGKNNISIDISIKP